jgi:hypothetical protein
MTKQQAHLEEKPASTSGDERVIPFKRRASAPNAVGHRTQADHDAANDTGSARDLSRYERLAEDGDEFRRRIVANIAVLVFMMVLTGVGIWLAVSITHLRDIQDCILTGRRDCAGISAPQT